MYCLNACCKSRGSFWYNILASEDVTPEELAELNARFDGGVEITLVSPRALMLCSDSYLSLYDLYQMLEEEHAV